mgnify:CR=1 FL=1
MKTNMKIATLAAAAMFGVLATPSVHAANIVETAKGAGLVGALSGEGPLTVFAPTDEAFAALPAGTIESLLKPENKDQLVAVLSYHVLGVNQH